MKKIAVCGYTSSVGNKFCKNTKFQIVKIGRKDADVQMDLLDGKATGDINILKDCDALINFAALSECDSDAEKNNMIKVNVNGPLFLAELANEYNIPYIIHISSISATYRETDNFYGYYSITKKTGEDLLKLYCKQKQIGLCILEPTAMYGDQSFAKHQKLLYNIINQVRNNETVTLYGKNDAKRNYLDVEILCSVIEKLLDKDLQGKYIVANMKNCSLSEIVDELDSYFGHKSNICFMSEKPDIMDCVINDEGKIYDLLEIEKPMGMTFNF
ncbi:NAD-dependent epimerase/dehydratase family protein [Pseudobutyrivibrio ruminis]|uniref:NAD-dependent epimerase/dehydratase domain-containing protein n=1 Tax=Pseudobutyrivibrio ruminis TaxID=46206 RepID=A0A2G3DUD0_9FIRM|nr:SDR family oxidoreductase [Pseudobutyrivibrio ruminis]PHU34541.1 hypothetical protein CSX01_09495 [Pseudobutyrivibrio ruminis]